MPTKIIAHRGASHSAPENTMAAFEIAYEMGANGIETDIHLTKDLVPVLIHDDDVKRTTDGFGYIQDFTWQEIKQLDAGTWFSIEFAGASIITLDDFLRWIKPKQLYIHLELKNNKIQYENLEFIVYELVDYYGLLDRTTISTFSVKSIKRMKPLQNKVEIAWLTSKSHKDLLTYTQSIGANALHIKYKLLKKSLIKQRTKGCFPIRIYTINKRRHMLRCFTHKVDGIFTDIPDRGVKYRNFIRTNED